MRHSLAAALSTALLLGAATALAQDSGVNRSDRAFAEVTKAERDFAALSLTAGLKRSFLAYAAPDSIIFRPMAVPAVPTLQKDTDTDGGARLDWWPAFGVIARSHDLALSVGPWALDNPSAPAEARTRYGYYATVWRKQPDGRWKFVIDGAGGRIDAPPVRVKGGPVAALPTSSARPIAASQALAQVRAAEAALSTAATTDARGAIRARLAQGAWLLGGGKEPSGSEGSVAAELGRRPATLSLSYQGGGASRAGDLAYTYGSVTSTDPAIPLRRASYIHVWQRQPAGWRIVFQGLKGL